MKLNLTLILTLTVYLTNPTSTKSYHLSVFYKVYKQVLSSSWDSLLFRHNRHQLKRGGRCAPFGGWGWLCPPSNTMWLGPRSISVERGILIHPAVWPQYMGWKLGGGAAVPPFLWGAGYPSNRMSPGPRPAWVPSDILIHPAVWPQQTWAENWGLCPFSEELGPHLTQCGRGLPPCQVSSWSIQPFGHNTPTLQTGQTDETTVR